MLIVILLYRGLSHEQSPLVMPTYPMNSDHYGCFPPLGRSAMARTLLRRLARDSHDVCTRLLAANGVPPAAEVGPGGVPTGQWSKPAKKMRKNDGSTRKIYGNHRKIMISIACIADLF